MFSRALVDGGWLGGKKTKVWLFCLATAPAVREFIISAAAFFTLVAPIAATSFLAGAGFVDSKASAVYIFAV